METYGNRRALKTGTCNGGSRLIQVLCSSRFVLINRSERNRMHGVWGISPHSSRCEILMVPLDSM
jgi:hypothetical protein